MSQVELSKKRRADLIRAIKTYFLENHDEEIGDLKAALLLDFFLQKLGPTVYNQAIRDSQAYFQTKIEDLEAEHYQPEDDR